MALRSRDAASILFVCSLFPSLAAFGADDSYPSKPVRVIVPFAYGGSTSVMARLIGQKLSEMWRQPVVVENRPGGETAVGTEVVFRSPPDGYAILAGSSSFAINASLRKTPYDALRDFAPVTTVSRSPYVLVTHPTLPPRTLKAFIALAKSRPGELDYASTGAANFLATELLCLEAGIRMTHVPYKGGGPAINDLLGGHVQVHITTAVNMIPLVKSGRLRGLAISGDDRLPALSEVPTFAEAGLPAFKSQNWNGIIVPIKTPRHIVERLSADFGKVLDMPEVKEKMDAQGNFASRSTPDQFAALIKSEVERFARVVKAANIPMEQ